MKAINLEVYLNHLYTANPLLSGDAHMFSLLSEVSAMVVVVDHYSTSSNELTDSNRLAYAALAQLILIKSLTLSLALNPTKFVKNQWLVDTLFRNPFGFESHPLFRNPLRFESHPLSNQGKRQEFRHALVGLVATLSRLLSDSYEGFIFSAREVRDIYRSVALMMSLLGINPAKEVELLMEQAGLPVQMTLEGLDTDQSN